WLAQVAGGDWQLAGAAPLPGSGWLTIIALCLLFLPQLSLGLSGFEMSLIVMPQVRGTAGDDPQLPQTRIRNTRKVLITAALVMSVYLVTAVLVTTVLVPPEALGANGRAVNRALAYLAHGGVLPSGEGPAQLCPLFGHLFGSLYDLSAVLLLCLAGTSLMAALGALLP